MAEFESPGEWWLPDTPEARVAGIVKATETGLKVTFFQPLAGESLFTADVQRYQTIYGSVHESPLQGGTEVTLFDAFAVNRSLRSNGSASETIVANRCYIGDVHLPSREEAFDRYEATLAGIAEWLPLNAVHRHVEASGTVKIDLASERKSFEVGDDGEMAFIADGHVHISPGQLTFRNERRIELRLGAPLAHDAATRAFLIPLRNFISLVTGRPSRLRSCSIVVGDGEPSPQVVHDLSLWSRERNVTPDEERLSEPLLPAPKDSAVLSALMTRWWALARAHRRVLDFAFGVLEEPPRYVEVRFSTASMVIDLFAQRFAAGDPVALLSRIPQDVSRGFGTAPGFVSRWSELRTRLWDDPAPSTAEVLAVTNALMWLVRIVLLQEVGAELDGLLYSRRFEHMVSRLRG